MGRKLTELEQATQIASGDFLDTSQDLGNGSYMSKKLDYSTLQNAILTGNSASATKLASTKNINGIAFDGTADVTVPSDISPGAAGNIMTSTGAVWTSSVPAATGVNTGDQVADGVSISGVGTVADPFKTVFTKNQINIRSTGLSSGGVISAAISLGVGKFDISAGEGIIVDNHTDPANPVMTVVSWGDKFDEETPYLLTDSTTYIGIGILGNLIFSTETFTPLQRRESIELGWVDHPDNATIAFSSQEPPVNADLQCQFNDFLESFGSFNVLGNNYAPSSVTSSPNLKIKKSYGQTFDNNANYQFDKSNPHIIDNPAEDPCDIYYYYRDGGTGWVNDTPISSVIDPDHWDDGSGTLATVPPDNWTIQIISLYPVTGYSGNDIQYGQAVYPDLDSAKAAVSTEVALNPYNSYDSYRTYLFIKKGATDLTNIAQAVFSNAGKLGLFGSGGSVSGIGTVTLVSVATANGVSGTVTNDTTTPEITISLGSIIPSTVNGLTLVSEASGFSVSGGTTSKSLTVPLDASVSGTNTGDQVGDGVTITGSGTVASPFVSVESDPVFEAWKLATPPVYTDQTSPQTVSNGQVTFEDGVKLGTTPTVGSFEEGKIFYDATNKTVSAMIAGDVTLQIGQESHVLVYNDTGVTIPNGSVVRTTGVNGGMQTIGLAQADTPQNSLVLGMATQDILDGNSGLITTRGVVRDLNTSTYTTNFPLYLSPTVPGGVTQTMPTSVSDYVVEVGRTLDVGASGSIYINLSSNTRLADLLDVSLLSPEADQILKYNGTKWVNGSTSTISAGLGVSFFLDDAKLIPVGSGPDTYPLETLLKAPGSSGQESESVTVNNSTAMIDQYMFNTALGVTSIDAGIWRFNTSCNVDDASGDTEIIITTGLVSVGTGTVSITGTGVSRTAIVSGGTPFVAGDFNADILLTSRLITPKGVFPIIGFTSSSEVTISTLGTYSNESTVAYSLEKYLFQSSTGFISNLSIEEKSIPAIEPAFPCAVTDKLAVRYYARTSNIGDVLVSFYHGGSTNYSNFLTPLAVRHNDLPGIYGGNSAERYHLTAAEAAVVASTSGVNTGNQDLSGYAKLNGTNHPFSYVKTPKIYPASDSTTAVQVLKADGSTPIMNFDSTNKIVTVSGSFKSVNSGTITRTSGLVSGMIVGSRSLTISRNATGYVTSMTDGENTWSYTRDSNNNITSWATT